MCHSCHVNFRHKICAPRREVAYSSGHVSLAQYNDMEIGDYPQRETVEMNKCWGLLFSFGFDDGGMHTRTFSLRSGYEVLPNFKPFLNLETLIGLYHKEMKKDYYNTANIGLLLSAIFCN